mgnify:FL=1
MSASGVQELASRQRAYPHFDRVPALLVELGSIATALDALGVSQQQAEERSRRKKEEEAKEAEERRQLQEQKERFMLKELLEKYPLLAKAEDEPNQRSINL